MKLSVKVTAGAAKTEWAGEMADGTRKVRVHAVREGGAANAEFVKFLAKEFGVPTSSVEIQRGMTSSRKLVNIKT